MYRYLYVVVVASVLLFAGCGLFRELGPALQEGVQQAGAPPVNQITSPSPNYVAIGSYLLNVALGTWAAYERRKKTK